MIMQKTNRLLEQASELASLEEFAEAFAIYDKIIGLKTVKEEIKYYMEFINNSDKYIDWEVKIPKGILLAGTFNPTASATSLINIGVAPQHTPI